MTGKIVVSVISVILVVGCAIGVFAVVKHSRDNGGVVTSHSKAVAALCQKSNKQQLCEDTLGPVNTNDPKDYIKTVLQSAMDSVIKAFNMSDKLTVENSKSEEGMKMALEDCRDLMQVAIHELEASQILVKDNDIRNVHERSADLQNWLGAVISYQQSCLEQFDTDAEKKVMSQLQTDGGLDDVQKITAVALDVVAGISELLGAYDLTLNVKPSSRRLLEVDHEGYPTWFSAADRKLLARGRGRGQGVTPNAVVAKDGSGQYKTVLDAIMAYPKNHQGRYVIYVKAGVYDEYILIDKKMPNIFMYGDGPTKTIITGKKSRTGGYKTMRSATFATQADNFIGKDMTFENTAGPEGEQAVALRVQGENSAFYNCHIVGYQDSLYAQSKRQFYRDCEISGTVDFIFGVSSTVVQNSKIIVRKPGPNQKNILVADGSPEPNMPTGIVLHKCEVVPEPALVPERLQVPTYLARPWKAYSKAVFMENILGDLIQPEGYLPWLGDLYLNTCFFAEYANTGPGAKADRRVNWGRGQLSKAAA
ncbi:pectinesterase family protein, partial [Pasteurella multocida]